MKKFGKRLITLCCCILMATVLITAAAAETAENCTGECTHQAAIGTTHYTTLEEAFAAATDGCTVTLLRDASAAALTLDKAITLDLGGKTLTGTNTETESLLQVAKDCKLTNGTMTTNAGTVLLAKDCAVIIEETAVLTAGDGVIALRLHSTLTKASATITGQLTNSGNAPVISTTFQEDGSCQVQIEKPATITAKDSNAIEMQGAGALVITGGTISAKENAIVLNIADNKTMEASITGGKLTAEKGQIITITKGENATAPKDFVLGGTYNKLPTDYIPANCRTTDNGDNTHTVTAEYAVSISANGGSGTMATAKVDRGTVILLPKCTLTAPAGKHFKAWQIGENSYAPGASFAVNGDVTLTAVWEDHNGGVATCTQKATCAVCGTVYGNYASHYLSVSGGYAATCDAAGMNSHTRCSACGQYFVSGIQISASSLTIPALGHDMKSVEGKEATCTEEGIQAHEKCSQCDLLQIKGKDISEKDLVIPAKGHSLEKISAVDATCTQPGVVAHEQCKDCKLLFVNGREVTESATAVPVVSHILSDWESDANTHWKSCTGCGEIFRQHSHADTDSDGSCNECGYAMPTSVETNPTDEEVSFPFLIPVIVAVVIAVGGVVMVVTKKKN